MELLQTYADAFEWRHGQTPLSSWEAVLGTALGYCLVVKVFLPMALGGKAVPLGHIPAIHNLILWAWSLAMFVGTLREAVKETERQGSYTWLFCFDINTKPKGALFFWSYVYYVSKYYELLDTAIMLLKAKPVIFLHWFHHAVVLVMSYLWLEGVQSLQVIALLTNTGIHIIMYWYYFLCSLGHRPWWKVLVTNGQIVQFCFSFMTLFPFLREHYSASRAPGGCAGSAALKFNAAFNAALLLLFVGFHRRSYRGAGGKGKKHK